MTVDAAGARAALGYMPDLAPVYEDLKVWEFLDVFARAHGLVGEDRKRRVGEVLDAVSLGTKREAKAGSLSRGMTQRLVLAKTLLHQPKVMLLDEPASGLDPVARIELRDLLRRLSDAKHTVLISSHILTELAGFCTSVGIMEKGRMVVSGPIAELAKSADASRQLTIELLAPAADFVAGLKAEAGVAEVTADQMTLDVRFVGEAADAAALLKRLVGQGLPVVGFAERKVGIEDIMLRVGAKEVS